jgi:hypothetical protein
MSANKYVGNWRNILWREWNYCGDKEYAQHLFQTVATSPSSRPNRSTISPPSRPYAAQVEAALHTACTEQWRARNIWEKRLERLGQARCESTPIKELITKLQDNHWFERFLARHVLLYRGAQAVDHLDHLRVLTQNELHPLQQQTARWLIESISSETTVHLAQISIEEWLCPECLVHCQTWTERSWKPALSFYGCRYCHRNWELFYCPAGVVAVLDVQAENHTQKNGFLYANWLIHRTVFDFDSVEIIQATDEDVERFAVQVGNDTDLFRKSRYKQMRCIIERECRLSKNTVHILENTFGEISRRNV